jgi:hypothetical protein
MSRCESSRWLRWLSLGSLTGLTFLLGLTIALSACEEEAGLALRPVELVDPAPSDPLDIDPLLGPPALDCGDCAERRIELPGGDVVTIRGEDEPVLRIAPEAVAFVELASEGGEGGDGAALVERFGVYAVLDEGAREAWRAFAAAHARRFVLVEIGGRPVDLVRLLGWSRGLRIGVFEDEAARAAYLRTLPFERSGERPGG